MSKHAYVTLFRQMIKFEATKKDQSILCYCPLQAKIIDNETKLSFLSGCKSPVSGLFSKGNNCM